MGQKYSTNRGDHWEVCYWLVFDAWGGVRLTRGEPDLKQGERGMAVTSRIPHALFRVPQLRATINVAEPVRNDMKIDVEAAGDALKKVIGAEIVVEVTQPEPVGG